MLQSGPPEALRSVYGVKAQMLLPLINGAQDKVQAWISVHFVPSPREWIEDEARTLLHEAGIKVLWHFTCSWLSQVDSRSGEDRIVWSGGIRSISITSGRYLW